NRAPTTTGCCATCRAAATPWSRRSIFRTSTRCSACSRANTFSTNVCGCPRRPIPAHPFRPPPGLSPPNRMNEVSIMHIHDLIGIGFGPSNIALAIALEEHGQRHGKVDACFIERQGGFAWHPDMLLDHAHMQISFLKDLVTPRNPSSRYSFLNYLHEKSRLQDFINLKTFFPSRHEFNDYLAWTASHFEHQCAFGESVFEVLPEMQGKDVSLLRVRSRDASGQVHERLTRSLVIGV